MTSSADLGITHEVRFSPKHGTAERWGDCNCYDCRTNRVGRTLNLDEIRGAVEAGVDACRLLDDVGDRGGMFHRSERADRSWWTYLHPSQSSEDEDCDEVACAALDRVREYWRRRALAEYRAAAVAHHLAMALSEAREYAQLFAQIGDDGVLPIDKAQAHRARSADLGISIKEIERLLNSYKVHGDVP